MNEIGSIILEIIWITLGIICFFLAINNIFIRNYKQFFVYLLLSLLCFLMFMLRKYLRKKK